jgi:hypothetical protein
MVNVAVPTMEIALDDGQEPHKAKCSLRVFETFEKLTSRNPWDPAQMKDLKPKDWIALITAAIYPNNAEEKLAEVMDSISLAQALEVGTKLLEKLVEGSGEKKSESKKAGTTAGQ